MKKRATLPSLATTAVLLSTTALLPALANAQMRMGPPAPKVEFPAGVDTVEVPFELEGHLVLFSAKVNDLETLRFILDTGASAAVLREADWVEKLELPVLGQARVGGAGSGSMGTVTLAGPVTIEIGGLEIVQQMIGVGLGEDLPGMTWNGAVGAGLLSQVVAEIDYEHSVLRLHDPESFEMPSNAIVLPTEILSSGIAAVESEVSIDGRTEKRWLAVDIGAFHSLSLNADETILPSTRLEEPVTLGWGSQGAVPGHIGVVDSLRLGDIELTDLVTSFPGPEGLRGIRRLAEDDVRVTGNLGSAVLRHHTVIVDHPHNRLGLVPRRTPPAPFNFSSTGMVSKPATTEAGFLIQDVLPGTPAEEAGLRPGDLVRRLNGELVAGQGIGIRTRLIDPPPGTRLELTVERDGQSIDATLIARPLFPSE